MRQGAVETAGNYLGSSSHVGVSLKRNGPGETESPAAETAGATTPKAA